MNIENNHLSNSVDILGETRTSFSTFENLSGNTTAELEKIIADLSLVCHEFDPYTPSLLSEEIKEILIGYNLMEHTHDPFTFTNKMLKVLTSAENELKERQ